SIRDRMRTTAAGETGAFMDQNQNAVTQQNPADVFAVPLPTNGTPFQLPYDKDTLPLILTGPHVIGTSVPGNPVTADNLVLNTTNNALDVTFDRDIDATTFQPANILRIT